MGLIKEYIRAHSGEMIIIGVTSVVAVGLAIAVGTHPMDALGHGRR